ncbi:MAG: glucose-1-phosphate adenylyltransferase [Candidatus Cloacimonadota bacterium]|nr:MAG: glucose-1-phosphate adenylyltransferase [Candidatus Cloacimonadota bacterium]
MRPEILGLILAGGKGTRLEPLTKFRSKPAVPFGGRYRIIDFVLSNFINSGIYSLYVLTQFKSQSLTEHIYSTYQFGSLIENQFVTCVPAQMQEGDHWYEGTADAIFQNINLIREKNPYLTAIFGGDHIYRMDVSAMAKYHNEKGADCTIAAISVPIEEATEFGVIQVDRDWKIIGFQEKPAEPKSLPNDPTRALVSMGNYIFNTRELIKNLQEDAINKDSSHDFGKDVLPKMMLEGHLYAYDFNRNMVPGATQMEEEAYWRDVGTIDSYFEANMDLRSVSPAFNLYNDEWPIKSRVTNLPPAKFVHLGPHRTGQAINSIVCEGAIISGATIKDSIISPNVRINSYSTVDTCIIMDNVEIGRDCKLKNCIIDKNVDIPSGTEIGYDLEEDKKHYTVTESGFVILEKNRRFLT